MRPHSRGLRLEFAEFQVDAAAVERARCRIDMPTYWYCYLVRCNDHSLYVGSTTDINRALSEHNVGAGAGYTRLKRPVRLAYCERLRTKSAAVRRAAVLRRLPKHHKEVLVLGARGAKLHLWDGIAAPRPAAGAA